MSWKDPEAEHFFESHLSQLVSFNELCVSCRRARLSTLFCTYGVALNGIEQCQDLRRSDQERRSQPPGWLGLPGPVFCGEVIVKRIRVASASSSGRQFQSTRLPNTVPIGRRGWFYILIFTKSNLHELAKLEKDHEICQLESTAIMSQIESPAQCPVVDEVGTCERRLRDIRDGVKTRLLSWCNQPNARIQKPSVWINVHPIFSEFWILYPTLVEARAATFELCVKPANTCHWANATI